MANDSDAVEVLSLLTPEDMRGRPGGMPPEAIAAAYRGRMPEKLAGNPAFVTFLHDVIRRRGPMDPALRAEARREGDGYLYIVDEGTPDGAMGRVPPDDIIGAFEIRDGRVIAASYQPNPRYAVYSRARAGHGSSRGLVKLSATLEKVLLDALRALPPYHANRPSDPRLAPAPPARTRPDAARRTPGRRARPRRDPRRDRR